MYFAPVVRHIKFLINSNELLLQRAAYEKAPLRVFSKITQKREEYVMSLS